MKKALCLLILSFMLLPCLFAVTGTYEFRYMLTKTTNVGISWIFTDMSGNQINAHNVDLDKTLDTPQVQLVISTNRTARYDLRLTFGAMKQNGDPESDFIGQYKARVSEIYDTPSIRNAQFASAAAASATVEFPGDTSKSAGTTISQAYPIALDFSDYIDDYGPGSFTGTLTVEVITE